MFCHLVRALTGFADFVRERPTMRPVAAIGLHAWEWTFHGVQFQAVWFTDSSVVTLRFRTGNGSEWTVSHQRAVEEQPAQRIAEEMFQDTTGGLA
jgi:hypothetical protein